MRRSAFAALLLAAWPLQARGESVRVIAYDEGGKLLETQALLKHISPAGAEGAGESAGLYLAGLSGAAAQGRPWWVRSSTAPQWSWSGAERVRASLPWPVPQDGFSTVRLDGDGSGYADGGIVFLNEDAAKTAWRQFRESLDYRVKSSTPAYRPSPEFRRLEDRAKEAMTQAHRPEDPRLRARLFDQALGDISAAWQKLLFEHGAQAAADPARGAGLRWGLTLDETAADRLAELDFIAERAAASGADSVRLVFRLNPEDFYYERGSSFAVYDRIVRAFSVRGLRVMGSVLDSALWPRSLTPQDYVDRTRNLVSHYSSTSSERAVQIRSWEVASEPNGNWLGGWRNPLPDETILVSVSSAAAEVKRIDPSLETVATLYWWEGTAQDDRHPLFAWLAWSLPRGFGTDIDILGLSIYPNDNPMGIALDPAWRRLSELFPDKKLMLGGFGFMEKDSLHGYWWLEPDSVWEARKDILVLYTGAACALPRSVGGGFWWQALDQMLAEGKKPQALLRLYGSTLKRLKTPAP
ncbi:MAG: hypothetical protein AAB412_07365 [Elusimicrobiota bacterium]